MLFKSWFRQVGIAIVCLLFIMPGVRKVNAATNTIPIDDVILTASTYTYTFNVYSKIEDFVGLRDIDGDNYYEEFDFKIGIDGDVYPGSAKVIAKMICTTTGQEWWTNSWSITGTATDYQWFTFDETDFTGHFTGDTALDFTIELWNEAKTVKLAEATSVINEPVKADTEDIEVMRNYIPGASENPSSVPCYLNNGSIVPRTRLQP